MCHSVCSYRSHHVIVIKSGQYLQCIQVKSKTNRHYLLKCWIIIKPQRCVVINELWCKYRNRGIFTGGNREKKSVPICEVSLLVRCPLVNILLYCFVNKWCITFQTLILLSLSCQEFVFVYWLLVDYHFQDGLQWSGALLPWSRGRRIWPRVWPPWSKRLYIWPGKQRSSKWNVNSVCLLRSVFSLYLWTLLRQRALRVYYVMDQIVSLTVNASLCLDIFADTFLPLFILSSNWKWPIWCFYRI